MVLLSIVDLSVKKAFGHLKLCADLTLDFPFLLFMFVIYRSTRMGMHCSFGAFFVSLSFASSGYECEKKERTKVRENAINRLYEIKQPGDYTIRTIQIAYHNALAFHAKRLREREEEII